MTRFRTHFAVFLAVAGVISSAGCELIVGGHHIPGTGGATTTTNTGGSTGGSGGTTSTGGSGGKSTGGTGGTGTGGTGTGGTGTGGTGTGGTGPMCGPGVMACMDATDCPDPGNECVLAACDMGCCTTTNVADLTPTVAGQTAADCQMVVCDGSGGVKSIPDDNDPLDDGNDCTADACSNGSPTNLPLAAGTVCASLGGTLCDGNGACVECLADTDCVMGFVCDPVNGSHTCVAESCTDTVQSGAETDVDCGGGACPTCTTGKLCLVDGDCFDSVCSGSPATCQAPLCTDTVENGAETDVDCGGGTCPKCGPNLGCAVDADCIGGSCSGTVCLPTCSDAVKNAGESDVDCGGATCNKCSPGKTCNAPTDCSSGVCTGGVCQAPTCTDTVKNGSETGTDCGGGTCPICPAGQGCTSGTDCSSGVCAGSPLVCQAPTCSDLVKNGTETDVDCGGSCSTKCGVGKMCGTGADCASSVCNGGLCGSANCGDGIKSVGEGCDDGNKNNGDGCSSVCFIEFGYTCSGTPSVCATTCGDGFKAASEGCDDHNTGAGDGCSPTCTVETGYTCTGSAPSACTTTCGDGLKAGIEGCDDGNVIDGDGCSATCGAEPGFTCAGQGPGSCTSTCGDGTKASNEGCDDSNTNDGDGCSAACAVEAGFTCTGTAPSVCSTTCGDGVKAGAEGCDDGNTSNSDGCSSACAAELGFTCTGGGPGSCTSTCGDGTKASNEGCDDNNTNDGDGCSSACAVEPGYNCVGNQPSVCSGGCGDNIVAGAETCDDGNLIDGDGCSSACGQEMGWLCLGGGPGSCLPDCGDGLVIGGELCDDGNLIDGDGCSALCASEMGWTCVGGGAGSCTPTCGDGMLVGAEVCDDGNTSNNDGCSSACAQESGWTCVGAGAGSCTTTCGDGIKVGAETCDDGNTVDGDCCSSACQIEAGCEIEPNNTCGASVNPLPAFSGSPLTTSIKGDLKPGSTDIDLFSFTIPGTHPATVKLETYFGTPGTCTSTSANDTYMELRSTTCTGFLASDDDSGPGYCALIDTTVSSAVKNLAPATYFVDVEHSTGSANALGYTLLVTIVSTCGDGNVETGEGCDDGNNTAGDGCSPTCTVETGYSCAGSPSACAPNCGNGTLNSGEACDDANGTAGDGCDAICKVEPGYTCTGAGAGSCVFTCGNGTITGNEKCDDGNTTSGDGCDATCQFEATGETEPNTTCATANGPFTIPQGINGRLFSGSLTPATDQDWYSFTIPVYADLSFETFDSTGPGSCAPSTIDTELQLFKSDCTTTQSPVQDQGGIGNCSRLNPTTQPTAMKHMAPGTYVLKVFNFSTTSTYSYTLQAKYVAYCGDGVVQGSEQCDGGAGCAADCTLLPVCGNGLLQSGEQCDDGNAVSGDGCSATCQWETVNEAEPNGTTAEADTNATNNAQLLIDSNRNILGGISGSTDKDIFKLVVASNDTVVHLETFDSSGIDCRTAAPYNMAGHALRILNSGGTTMVTDFESSGSAGATNTYQSGIGVCAALSYRLDAGTYYVQVDKTAALAAYFLRVVFQTPLGSELEPNDAYTSATPALGRSTQIFGDHQVPTDTDFYAIDVPAGGSIRAEVIEGDTAETCESNGIDSEIALYGPTGTLISTTGGDVGRGYCSLFDGTGSSPLNSFAHNLAAGTYYIRVISFGTSVANGNQFNYRLVVSLGY